VGTAYFKLRDPAVAEDVVQDVFIKLLEQGSKINLDLQPLAYLRRMVSNKCIDILRSNQRLREKNKALSEVLDIKFSPDAEIDEEVKKKLKNALNLLPDRCKEVFLLAKMNKYSYKEIAEEMAISVKTVENQMGKALKVLREAMISLFLFINFLIWSDSMGVYNFSVV